MEMMHNQLTAAKEGQWSAEKMNGAKEDNAEKWMEGADNIEFHR